MVNIKLTHNFSTLILLLRPHGEIRELCWGDISKGLYEIRLSFFIVSIMST